MPYGIGIAYLSSVAAVSWASLTFASLKWNTISCLGTGALVCYWKHTVWIFSESILLAVASCFISSVDARTEIGFSKDLWPKIMLFKSGLHVQLVSLRENNFRYYHLANTEFQTTFVFLRAWCSMGRNYYFAAR